MPMAASMWTGPSPMPRRCSGTAYSGARSQAIRWTSSCRPPLKPSADFGLRRFQDRDDCLEFSLRPDTAIILLHEGPPARQVFEYLPRHHRRSMARRIGLQGKPGELFENQANGLRNADTNRRVQRGVLFAHRNFGDVRVAGQDEGDALRRAPGHGRMQGSTSQMDRASEAGEQTG